MTFAQPRDVSSACGETLPSALLPPLPVLAEPVPPPSASISSQLLAAPVATLDVAPGPVGPGPSAVHGHCRLLLCSGPESVKAAREFTAATLEGWHLGDLVQEAMIIVTELVTNAIRHGSSCACDEAGRGQVELAWQRDTGRVICVVTDGSARPPVLVASDLFAESGRGLQVVQALAAAWGWMMLGATQKAVWAALQVVAG